MFFLLVFILFAGGMLLLVLAVSLPILVLGATAELCSWTYRRTVAYARTVASRLGRHVLGSHGITRMVEGVRSSGKQLTPSSSLTAMLSAPSQALDLPPRGGPGLSEGQRLQLRECLRGALVELERMRVIELGRTSRTHRSNLMMLPRVLGSSLLVPMALCAAVSVIWLIGIILLIVYAKLPAMILSDFWGFAESVSQLINRALSGTWDCVTNHPIATAIVVANCAVFSVIMENMDDSYGRKPKERQTREVDDRVVTECAQRIANAAWFESCLDSDPYRTTDVITWRRGGDVIASLLITELSPARSNA